MRWYQRRAAAAVLAVCASGAGLSGCAKAPQPAVVGRTLPPCDSISGSGTSASRGLAMVYAQRQAAQIYPDVRGDLLGVGYRRIRVINRTTTCRPYRLAGFDTGLTSCVTRVRICGR